MEMETKNTLPKSDLQKMSTSHSMLAHEIEMKKLKQNTRKNEVLSKNIKSKAKVSRFELSSIILLI